MCDANLVLWCSVDRLTPTPDFNYLAKKERKTSSMHVLSARASLSNHESWHNSATCSLPRLPTSRRPPLRRLPLPCSPPLHRPPSLAQIWSVRARWRWIQQQKKKIPFSVIKFLCQRLADKKFSVPTENSATDREIFFFWRFHRYPDKKILISCTCISDLLYFFVGSVAIGKFL